MPAARGPRPKFTGARRVIMQGLALEAPHALSSLPMLPMSACRLVDTDSLPPPILHAAFTLAFSDYIAGPFVLGLDQWPAFLARQGIDLRLGRAALQAETGEVMAFSLVAPRLGLGRWRLGTMGAVPPARGGGAAVQLLQDLVQRGRVAGLGALELEVFAQNERALRLYRRHGFEARHALFGWRRAAGRVLADGGPDRPVTALGSDDALAWLRAAEADLPDLPLQVCAPVVSALTVPWSAWRCDAAQLVFTHDATAGVIVRSLVDRDPGQAGAEALLRQLLAEHPDAAVSVPPLQRQDLGGDALARCGFVRDALHQWFMRRDLLPPSA